MPFNKNRNSRDDKSGKDFKKSDRSETTGRSKFGDKPFSSNNNKDKKPYGDKNEGFEKKRPYGTREGKRAFDEKKSFGDKRAGFGGKKAFDDRNTDDKRKSFGNKKEGFDRKKTFGDRNFDDRKKSFGDRDFETRKPFVSSDKSFNKDEAPFKRRDTNDRDSFKSREHKGNFRKRKETSEENPNAYHDDQVKLTSKNPKGGFKKDGELIRLNRFIANSGICSRRKADELIIAGVVTVNGEVVSELGAKINPAVDQIRYNGELLKREKMVYVLLNKPKDYITTTDDPQERKTVMELVDKASKERIYPVGRLDRNTTGLLLLTNDGDLADRLSHPKNSVSKIYHVELNRSLTQGDFNKIAFGLELEDGLIKPDEVKYVTGGSKKEVGIQIHSGKNRIVRRIFESLGYEVVKLDRVIYANLTKKDLTRGRWRYLTDKEVIQLKHFTKGQY